jgi:hypothetical protein
MKPAKITIGVILFLIVSSLSSFAQEFILTTTNANIISSKASIDLPGLSGNPLAIIVAMPLGDTETLNPHPIGAWCYGNKWNVFNRGPRCHAAAGKIKDSVFLETRCG